jgi:hypothetical protein
MSNEEETHQSHTTQNGKPTMQSEMCIIESPGCFQEWQLIFPSSFHLLHVKHLLMTLSFAQFIHASLKMHH